MAGEWLVLIGGISAIQNQPAPLDDEEIAPDRWCLKVHIGEDGHARTPRRTNNRRPAK
jgi:hypothetical protein